MSNTVSLADIPIYWHIKLLHDQIKVLKAFNVFSRFRNLNYKIFFSSKLISMLLFSIILNMVTFNDSFIDVK